MLHTNLLHLQGKPVGNSLHIYQIKTIFQNWNFNKNKWCFSSKWPTPIPIHELFIEVVSTSEPMTPN